MSVCGLKRITKSQPVHPRPRAAQLSEPGPSAERISAYGKCSLNNDQRCSMQLGMLESGLCKRSGEHDGRDGGPQMEQRLVVSHFFLQTNQL